MSEKIASERSMTANNKIMIKSNMNALSKSTFRSLGMCLLWEMKKLIYNFSLPAVVILVCDLLLWMLPASVCAAIEENFGLPVVLLSFVYQYSLIIILSLIFKRINDEYRSPHFEMERLCYPSIWIRSVSRISSWILLIFYIEIMTEFGVKMLSKFSMEYVNIYKKTINAPLWFTLFELGILIPLLYRILYLFLYQIHNSPHPCIAFLITLLAQKHLTNSDSDFFVPFLIQIAACILIFFVGNRMEKRLIE